MTYELNHYFVEYDDDRKYDEAWNDGIPDTVEGFTWQEAIDDLKKYLTNVPFTELQWLVWHMRRGDLDGTRPDPNGGSMGCVICALGLHAVPYADEYKAFEAFGAKYMGGEKPHPDLEKSPFQAWLYLIKWGDKPSNHPVAKMFVEAIEEIMIDKNPSWIAVQNQ